MHRNLLMIVNLLPIEVDSVSSCTFVSSSGNDSSDVDGVVSVVDEHAAGSRTQEWINSMSTVDGDTHSVNSTPADVQSRGI